MMTDHVGEKGPWPDAEYGWGFGASVRNRVAAFGPGTAGQYGWVGGGYAKAWVDPQERLAAYVAFPVTPPGDYALLDEFERLVYAAMTESYVD
jgi:CubicO group peptidase (beta-lactamase class C family)